MQTHENFIRQIADAAIELGELTDSERAELRAVKLVYGSGLAGTRGVTFFGRWKGVENTDRPFVELSAFGQSSIVQVCGTTVHELGHVLGGPQAGHGPLWHAACDKLGLRRIRAAGTNYVWAMFAPALRDRVTKLERPCEGQPVASVFGSGFLGLGTRAQPKIKGCQAGFGTRGGKSRGTGSGSRLRLFQCECGQKARASCDDLNATHNACGTLFQRV